MACPRIARKFRIEDIENSLELIFEYVKDMDSATWENDRKTIDAVIRNMEIIGEAATRVPEDIKEQYLNIPWQKMTGMRNILIHEYFGVDDDVLWQTVQVDLLALHLKIREILW